MRLKAIQRALLLFTLATIMVVIIFSMLGGGLFNFSSIAQASNAPQSYTNNGEMTTDIIRIKASSYQEPAANPANFGGLSENGTAAYMGIGTATPERILHLVGNVALFERSVNSAGFIIKRTPSNRWVFGVDDPAGFVIKTYPEGLASTARVAIGTDGRVAVNTTTPDVNTQLTVYRNGGNTITGRNSYGDAVYGESTDGYGLSGHSANSYGVYGSGGSGGSTGVYGYNNAGGEGVCGESVSNIGVHGISSSGRAVYGYSSSFTGVYGQSGSSGDGVEGQSVSGAGVYGHCTSGNGVFGQSSSGYGVCGSTTSGYAGYFVGDVHVTGTLTKALGAFKIDHPQDPENRYLSHSFVESPEMMNVYRGHAMLDEQGGAIIAMPSYFEVLNRDFEYQLTCIGGYAPVYVSEEIKGNSFSIAGGKAGMKVSWQVTGIRQDAYASAHPIVVEQEKPANEKGYYLYPVEWGQPKEKGINQALKP